MTDRGTDGRTERILIARPRLHSMQRGKNRLSGLVLESRKFVHWGGVKIRDVKASPRPRASGLGLGLETLLPRPRGFGLGLETFWPLPHVIAAAGARHR